MLQAPDSRANPRAHHCFGKVLAHQDVGHGRQQAAAKPWTKRPAMTCAIVGASAQSQRARAEDERPRRRSAVRAPTDGR